MIAGWAWHERLFLLLGSGIALASAVKPGSVSLTASVLFIVLVYGIMLALTRRGGRVRLLGNYLAAWAFYAGSSHVVTSLGIPLRHHELLAMDVFLFGQSPALSWQGVCRPWMYEVLSLGYLSYHVYLHWALLDTLWRDESWRSQISTRLFTAFAVGFTGYLLAPAAPPAAAFPELFHLPLQGGFLTGWNEQVNATLAAKYDAFPSLHVLITLTLLAWDWSRFRKRFWIMLIPSLLMLAATLVLRLHYAVDLLASLALFLIIHICHVRPSPRRSMGS